MQIWINAWLFSALLSAGVYFFARRALIAPRDSMVVAIAAFPAPLFVAVGGQNSFVYALDMVWPIAVYDAHRNWRLANPRLRMAAAAIVAGAGVSPLLIAAVFSGDRYDLMFAGMNLYRLVGAMALMVRFNAQRRRTNAATASWLHIFSWIVLVIGAAMAVQYVAGASSNVFGSVDPGSTGPLVRGHKMFFNVLGLFRASAGTFGVLAICAYAANAEASLGSQILTALGGVVGVAVIVLSGSKTSLVAGIAVLGLCFVLFRLSQLLRYVAFAAILVFGLANQGAVWRIVPPEITGFINSAGEEHESLDLRVTHWTQALKFIQSHPLILLGGAWRGSMPTDWKGSAYQPSYYHNEYVSILMLGGVWSLILYGAGMGALFKILWRGRLGTPPERFAFLSICAGLLQGLTYSHIQPTLHLGAVVAMLAATYGYGAAPLPGRRSTRFTYLPHAARIVLAVPLHH